MKKFLLSIILIVSAKFSFAQWNTSSTTPNYSLGNVGVATSNPLFPMDINVNTFGSVFHVINNKSAGWSSTLIYGQVAQGDSPNYDLIGLYNSNNVVKFNVRGDGSSYFSGNMGIGVSYPSSKLDVGGSINIADNNNLTWGGSYGPGIPTVAAKTNLGIFFYPAGSSSDAAVSLLSSGNLGIGTRSPDQKLTVNGTIHSTQVKVDLNVPGPDYVFKKNYNLPELTEVKSYIDKNHHLSEIPSAAQMEKNGVDLGEMNIKLLKKVEELTLYLIEKDGEIKDLKKQFATFKKQSRIMK